MKTDTTPVPSAETDCSAVPACSPNWHIFAGGLPQPGALCQCGQRMAGVKAGTIVPVEEALLFGRRVRIVGKSKNGLRSVIVYADKHRSGRARSHGLTRHYVNNGLLEPLNEGGCSVPKEPL